jgi:hypothetical protein
MIPCGARMLGEIKIAEHAKRDAEKTIKSQGSKRAGKGKQRSPPSLKPESFRIGELQNSVRV